jgi:catechol-2,3-dioxygenase
MLLTTRARIELQVRDADRSAAFYSALLRSDPTHRDPDGAVFELESPPLALTLRRIPRARKAPGILCFAIVVLQPQHVGRAAIALRKAGIALQLQDGGIMTHDPDGNGWSVRFVPMAPEPAVIPLADCG